MDEMDEMDLVVPLLTPIEFDAVKYNEMSLRELTVDELIAWERSTSHQLLIEQDRTFFSMMCGVPPQVIGKIKERDWRRLKQRYRDTLGKDELPQQTFA